MALVLIKEDGTGKADANSYADVAECDAYHEAHLYATSWTGATGTQKAAALCMATRVIDFEMQFNGVRKSSTQALQWPRRECLDPDGEAYPLGSKYSQERFFDEDSIPKILKDATCELARRLIQGDRTADPDGEGIKRFSLEGALSVEFERGDRKQPMPREVYRMLEKLGRAIGASGGAVKLVRT